MKLKVAAVWGIEVLIFHINAVMNTQIRSYFKNLLSKQSFYTWHMENITEGSFEDLC